MKKTIVLACALVSACAANATLLTNPDDPRTWQGASVGTFAELYFGSNTLANRQQVITQGLLDDGLFNASGFTAASLLRGGGTAGRSLDNTGTGSYDYVIEGTVPVAANSIDDKWFQSDGQVGQTVFDLGGLSSFCAVFPVIDHGPLPQESIESTVYLSNDHNDPASWVQAKVVRVWLEGFHPILGVHWDGFTYVVTTPNQTPFRYASIIHGGPGALISDGDDEINGLMGLRTVPEPSTLFAFGGLVAFLATRRKKA
ncbi:MAG: PEP-CTERM sorting domain-containing protein [Chthonomonas sp.]|nr:PEP-CTERM sorting domain-containing protein [Chthonomonas sp.]